MDGIYSNIETAVVITLMLDDSNVGRDMFSFEHNHVDRGEDGSTTMSKFTAAV